MTTTPRTPLFIRLVLCYHTLIIGLFGLAMLSAGLEPGITAERVELSCDRTLSNQCQLSRRNLYGRTQAQTLVIPSLARAELQSHTSPKKVGSNRRPTTTYRTAIATNEGVIFLDPVFSGGLGARDRRQAQVDQINQFIATPSQPTLQIAEDGRWFGLVFAVVFGSVGLGLLAIATAYRIRYDAATDSFAGKINPWGLGRFLLSKRQ